MTTGRGAKAQKKVGKRLGAGTYNAVYELPTSAAALPTGALHPLYQDTPQVLRASLPGETAEDARREHGLMRMFSELGVHPTIYAASINYDRPIAALSVMQKADPLDNYLMKPPPKTDKGAAQAQKMARSLWQQMCIVSDAGICMLDVKPGNILCLPEMSRCYLIDFDQLTFMDQELRNLFEKGPTGCAKARGAALAIMAMLMCLHIGSIEKPTWRTSAFVGFFEDALNKSRLPTRLFRRLGSSGEGLGGSGKGLASVLARNVKHYFRGNKGTRQEALRWFWDRLDERCKQPVCNTLVVRNVAYKDETAGCTASAKTVPVHSSSARELALESIDRTKNPCVSKGWSALRRFQLSRDLVFAHDAQGLARPLQTPAVELVASRCVQR